jgi:hypothetical protein
MQLHADVDVPPAWPKDDTSTFCHIALYPPTWFDQKLSKQDSFLPSKMAGPIHA